MPPSDFDDQLELDLIDDDWSDDPVVIVTRSAFPGRPELDYLGDLPSSDPELAAFIAEHHPRPTELPGAPGEFRRRKIVEVGSSVPVADAELSQRFDAETGEYYRKLYRFLESRAIAFRVGFPNDGNTTVEPTGGIAARLRCFLQEATIRADSSAEALRAQLEDESIDRPLLDFDILAWTEWSIRFGAVRRRLAEIATLVAWLPSLAADRFAIWLYVTAGGGKTAAFIPRD